MLNSITWIVITCRDYDWRQEKPVGTCNLSPIFLQQSRSLRRAADNKDSAAWQRLLWSHQDRKLIDCRSKFLLFKLLVKRKRQGGSPTKPKLTSKRPYDGISWYVKYLTPSVTYEKAWVLWIMRLHTSPMTSPHFVWNTKPHVMHWRTGVAVTLQNSSSFWKKSKKFFVLWQKPASVIRSGTEEVLSQAVSLGCSYWGNTS